MITTTRKERLLIRWYYLLPSLGMHGLFYIILISAEWIFLSMLDDLVFHDPGMHIFGLAIMLALIIAWTFIISYLILASRIDLNKKTWSSAAYKARKAKRGATSSEQDDDTSNAEAPAIGRRCGAQRARDYPEDSDGLAAAAARLARPLGISLPNPKRARRIALAASLIVLALAYVPHFIQRVAIMEQETETAAQTTRAIASALEDAGLDAFSIDPTEEHDELGYYVAADILDATGEKTGSYMRVDVDNTGTVVEVSYTLAIDPAASLEDNLARAEADLARMHAPLAARDIPARADGMLTYGALPEAFRQAFLAGSMYESIGLQYYELDDAGIVDGAEVNCYYFTDTEEDWDEHTEPRIYLLLEASN